MNYFLIKDLPGLRAGALIQYNETFGQYYVAKDSYADFYYFTQTEIANEDWFIAESKQLKKVIHQLQKDFMSVQIEMQVAEFNKPSRKIQAADLKYFEQLKKDWA